MLIEVVVVSVCVSYAVEKSNWNDEKPIGTDGFEALFVTLIDKRSPALIATELARSE